MIILSQKNIFFNGDLKLCFYTSLHKLMETKVHNNDNSLKTLKNLCFNFFQPNLLIEKGHDFVFIIFLPI